MRSRGKIFDWGFWKRTPTAAQSEIRLTIARRRIFARIHDLERDAAWATAQGRKIRASAGQHKGLVRAFLLWRAHRLEAAGRASLRAVVQLRKDSKAAGLDAVGHRTGRRDAFRDAGGGRG